MVNPLKDKTAPLVCSRLTAAGRGAIAVVEVRGVDAVKAIELVFRPFNRRAFSEIAHRKLVYGTWAPTGEDVVVCRLPRPSLASERFEIHCHGGTAAVDSIVSTLVNQGAVEASQLELPDPAGENLWRAEIWRTLPQATTERTASLMLRQLNHLPAAIEKLLALIERCQAGEAIRSLDQVLAWSDFGLSLTQTPSVVLCGQPNVGKSSLINAIVGFQRAIVHASAGTTRDVVSQRTAVDGWPIELSDTAGLRDAEGAIEGIGIENARRKIEEARLVIGVFDASREWSESDQQMLDRLGCDIVVHNKSDQATLQNGSETNDPTRPAGLATSATQNEGVEQLVQLIANRLVPKLPLADAAWCVNPEAVKRLQEARQCLLSERGAAGAPCARAARILAGDLIGTTTSDGL